MPTRPTLRCIAEDLHIPLPPINDPLNEIPHPLIIKANHQFADSNTAHERIRSIDDRVFFKAKVQRWRGAVWVNESERSWLVAAGQREEGSRNDFYDDLSQAARTARAHYNASHTPALTTDTYAASW